jgi:ParB/RepB/Spo0J family partition protein
MQRGEKAKQEQRAVPSPAAGGNWSRLGASMVGEMLDEMRAMTVQGVIDGTLPLRVPAASIEDPVGTDRLIDEDSSEDTESFLALVDNIRHRGLRVPLRVRPRDPAWRPNPTHPHVVDGVTFILQSGRRRLAACRELGVDPLVFLSFVPEDAARLDDLKERFFENAVRRQLSAFEKALSIGMIAEATAGTTQDQIAEIIGVPPTAVSRGLAVLRHREALQARLPSFATATTHEIQAALTELRQGELSSTDNAIRKRERRALQKVALPFRRVVYGKTRLDLRAARGGQLALTMTTSDLSPKDISEVAELVRGIVERRGATRGAG